MSDEAKPYPARAIDSPLSRAIDAHKSPLRLYCHQELARGIEIVLDNSTPEGTVEIRYPDGRLIGKIVNIGKRDEPGNRSRTKR